MLSEEVEDFKRLFYANRLTQYGKRKLIANYEEQMQKQQNKIDHLESRVQKLIEKLEDKLKLNNRDTELAVNGKLNLLSEEWSEIETENTLINEILSILKGEKE